MVVSQPSKLLVRVQIPARASTMKENILIICAHSDDEAAGIGGTILKYLKEGKKVIKIVLSSGEKSHPHLKEKVAKGMRKDETDEISKKLGTKTIYFNLKDSKLKTEITKESVKKELEKLIKKYKPKKIYTTSGSDPHPDHRAANKLTLDIVNKLKRKIDVYSYEVWNIINEEKPANYVDITPYIKDKIKMMRSFKSQWMFMYPLIPAAYLRSRRYGKKANCKYAEKFYKIK